MQYLDCGALSGDNEALPLDGYIPLDGENLPTDGEVLP